MFCPNCGRELPDDAKFCGSCGANLNAQPQGSAQTSQAQKTAQEQVGNAVAGLQSQVDKLQQKIDNSNSDVIKGRDAWDVIGLIGAACMLLGLIVPSLSTSGFLFTSGRSYSILELLLNAASSKNSASLASLFLLYFVPTICCAIDLLVVRENSTRHIRLVVMGAFNIWLQSSISSAANLLILIGGTLSAGYYISLVGSVAVIIVGIVGIVTARK